MANSAITRIMMADESGKELVQFAEQTADKLVKDNLRATQIRNIFTEVRQIGALWKQDNARAMRRLQMLKPKMAYQTARQRQVGGLRDVLSDAIDEVEKRPAGPEREAAFQRFLDLFEAILAYHKALGGKN
ncbi:MAG: type III-A CRISPR-associated protein Csm2 [Anaerolineae bacterium]|nr:type III-A CRISPR-associated protein Csm2 [Anaerolineae bacterium]